MTVIEPSPQRIETTLSYLLVMQDPTFTLWHSSDNGLFIDTWLAPFDEYEPVLKGTALLPRELVSDLQQRMAHFPSRRAIEAHLRQDDELMDQVYDAMEAALAGTAVAGA